MSLNQKRMVLVASMLLLYASVFLDAYDGSLGLKGGGDVNSEEHPVFYDLYFWFKLVAVSAVGGLCAMGLRKED